MVPASDIASAWAALLQRAADSVLLYDVRNRRVVDANFAARQWSPAGSSEPPAWLDAQLARWGMMTAAELARPHEIAVLHETGRARWLEALVHTHDAFGTRWLLAVLRDVTARKQAEQALLAERAAAMAADRAKSQFLATVSHEIRTPLNGIIGTLGLLGEPGGELGEGLATIRASADTLLTLLDAVLDLTKIEAGRMSVERTAFDLHAVVRESAALHRGNAERRGLGLRVELAGDLPQHVLGDATRVRQVLGNLLGNAVKFTEHGSVTVRGRARTDDSGLWVALEVADTGIGMNAAQRQRLFTPYAQADASTARRFGGTGLGLAISAQLARLMGGRIAVDSEPGRGSTFTLELPIALAAPPQAAPAGPAAAPDAPARGTVLVVDDNAVNLRVTTQMLRRMGLQVDTAEDGRAALQQFGERSYDLILMDCQMPLMDGFATTQAMRELESANGRHTPIVALTANVTSDDRERCFAVGMDDFLAKPLRLQQLTATVTRWLQPRRQ